MANNSLYIHIPFCRKKCYYCDFYSRLYTSKAAEDYINVLCLELKKISEEFDTVYIGGGTPSVLSQKSLIRLLKGIFKKQKTNCEFTVEVNPESFTIDKARLFADYGVNRISIGVQTFSDDLLTKLGRLHSASAAQEAVAIAQKGGFNNISIDLIFGISGQTMAGWSRDLNIAATIGVNHISTYALTYEPSTSLYQKIRSGDLEAVPDDLEAGMYLYAMRYLPKEKFYQYEISNFSQKGFYCRHNYNYWENGAYLGLGASAVSFRLGVRKKMIPEVSGYIAALKDGLSPACERECLTDLKRAYETAAFKIRTSSGVNFKWFKQRTGFDFLELEAANISRLIQDKCLRYLGNKRKPRGIALTRKGFLFCDEVSTALMP
jgi:oxygen-independent coproporphyrinogen III oxidase